MPVFLRTRRHGGIAVPLEIVYTHDVFAFQTYGGISRYLVEVIKRIPPAEARAWVFGGLYINEYMNELPQVAGIKVPVFKNTRYPINIANTLMHYARMALNDIAQEILVKPKAETVVHLSYYSRFLPKDNVKVVVTVHDMIHELFPDYFPVGDKTTERKKRCCERADKIIAVSHCTKRDLIKLFGIDETKIEVIYHGNSLEGIMPTYPVLSEPYILYVGSRSGYKNFLGFIQAYSCSPQLRNNFSILCFGGGRFSEQEQLRLNELGIKESVYFMEGDDSLLAGCYSHARAFVYPSLYEGFGIPPLEAMGSSCPVICSDRGPIPEVVEDAGVYFAPDSIESMKSTLEQVLFDDSLLLNMTAKGLQRASMFSWDKTAVETLSLYRSLT